MGRLREPGGTAASLRSALFFAGLALVTPVFALLVILFRPLPYPVRESTARLWCRAVLGWLRVTCGVRQRTLGREHLPGEPSVILSNHQSAWETIAFRTIFPARLSWIIKRSLFRIPFYGWALKALEEIGIDRDAGREALRQIADRGGRHLAAGRWVVVFPEGTRIAPPEPGRFGQGGARLACTAGVPAVPVAVDSGYCWPRDDWRKYPGTITVEIGPAIDTSGRSAAEVNRMARAWIDSRRPGIAWPRGEGDNGSAPGRAGEDPRAAQSPRWRETDMPAERDR